MITRKRLIGLSAAAVISALALSATPAMAADDATSTPTLDTLQKLTDSATEPEYQTLDSVAVVPTDVTSTEAIDASVEGTNIVIPVDAKSPLTLTRGAVSVGITLPFSDVASDAEKLTDGVVSHDNGNGNGNGSVTVPVVREEGVVQIATVISGATAPSEYEYTVDGGANVDSWNGQSRVNLMPGWWTYAIAAPLMDLEGWNEAVGQWGTTVRNALQSKTTMRQQFSCHAYGSWFAGEWNLEKARPTRTVDWTYGVAIHRCNWTTATQY